MGAVTDKLIQQFDKTQCCGQAMGRTQRSTKTEQNQNMAAVPW